MVVDVDGFGVSSAPPPPRESPVETFEKLRQAFDLLKGNHSDPWCWHEYLKAEPDEESEDEDAADIEMFMLQPKARKNVDRLKTHLLACIGELHRAAQIADMCYFHMCCTPKALRDCVLVLGSSGDVDEEMLTASGDGSPAKIMALMQTKLDQARAKIIQLEEEVLDLKDQLVDARATTKETKALFELSSMGSEEAYTRLNAVAIALNESELREQELQAAYDDVYSRLVRASRLMLYKGRESMRDRILKANKRENLFYAFQGFMYILQMEKEERIRRELEEKRNATEFALRNEVAFLLGETAMRLIATESLTLEVGRLKRDRRGLARFILDKYRPYSNLEYCLWVFESWQGIRKQLTLEKSVEKEQAANASSMQQLVHTSGLLPLLTKRVGELRINLASEKIAHDFSRKELTAAGARMAMGLVETLRAHRAQELMVLARLHRLDVEAKEERIAVLQRELSEDTHISALKGMVVELESHLRRALDRRKQKPYAVPPAGQKCVQCQREMLIRNWRLTPLQGMAQSISDADLAQSVALSGLSQMGTRSLGALRAGLGQSLALTSERGGGKTWSSEKQATYAAVWR